MTQCIFQARNQIKLHQRNLRKTSTKLSSKPRSTRTTVYSPGSFLWMNQKPILFRGTKIAIIITKRTRHMKRSSKKSARITTLSLFHSLTRSITTDKMEFIQKVQDTSAFLQKSSELLRKGI